MPENQPAFLGEAAAQRVEKWSPLLEGIDNDLDRAAVAMMLEMQKGYNTQLMQEAVTTADVKAFTRVSLGMIRRIYPNTLASRLVAMQPISMPTARIFYLDFKFGTDVAPVSAGDYLDYYNNNADPFTAYQNRINYTRGFVRGRVVGTGNGTETAYTIPLPTDGPWTERQSHQIQVNGNRAVRVDGAPVTIVTGAPGAGEVSWDPESGLLTFGTAPANAASIVVDYDLKFEGDDSRIPELGLELTSSDISVGSRKLKARWTVESAQDLRAYHGLDAEAELTSQASREIAIEIDREIIRDLMAGAVHAESWSSAYPGTTSGYSKIEYDSTLAHALIDLEHKIYKARQRRPNWIVTGPDTAARLEKMDSFRASGDSLAGPMSINSGPNVFGTLSGRYTVMVDPLFESNKILMGYKGGSFADAGYVYAPYIPLQMTAPFMDPNDWTPRKGFMTRYGKKMLAGDMYGIATIT